MQKIALTLLSLVLATQPAMSKELPEEVHAQIAQLSKTGDELADERKYRAAIEKYVEALQLLPEPMTDWEACTWLLTAIGDANFLARAFEQAKDALSDAMHCPGAIGNPFIHMRLGQAQFELGNMERASDELARAYLQEGLKYVSFIKSKLRPPPGGWPKGW
jgi:tetratricopeptide (TPR) repeat protein